MFQDDNGEWVDDECERCMVGRIRVTSKPFLKLFNNQVFTLPNAVCYECDVCGNYEFDDASYDIIYKMLDSLKALQCLHSATSENFPKIVHEEDLSKQTKFPPP